MNETSLKIRLTTIYFIMYSALSCYFAFLTPYFLDRKLTYVQIGTAFALMSLTSIVIQPAWGYITDKYLNKKRALMIVMGACSILMLSLVLAKSYIFIMISLFLIQSFHCPIMALSDTYCYDITEETKTLHYGKIRLMGSAGYAIGALALGWIIQQTNINSAYFAYTVLMLISLLLLNGIGFKGKKAADKPQFKDALNILKESRFIIFVLSVMIFNVALGAYNNNVPVLIEKTGGNVSDVGLLWFVIAISELPLFFAGGKVIKRFGELNVYIIAVLLYALRFFLSSLCGSYITVILIQLMQGLAYPLYLMGALQYVSDVVPSGLKATGITMLSALGFGLGNFLGSLIGGAIMQSYDVFILFKVITAISILGFLIGFIPKFIRKKEITA